MDVYKSNINITMHKYFVFCGNKDLFFFANKDCIKTTKIRGGLDKFGRSAGRKTINDNRNHFENIEDKSFRRDV